MATCKECLHFEVCQALEENGQVEKINPKICGCFKDKSKFVELPCKVGDTVYQIEEGFEVYPSVINRIIYETKGIAFDERAIGKSIFLTREEAEKALKEREQE